MLSRYKKWKYKRKTERILRSLELMGEHLRENYHDYTFERNGVKLGLLVPKSKEKKEMKKYEIEVSVWQEGVVNDKITVWIEAETEEEALGIFLKANTEYYVKLHGVRLYKEED